MKKSGKCIYSLCLALIASSLRAAVTLDDASSIWRFDMPDGATVGSTVVAGQIKDHTNTYTSTSISGDVRWASISQPSQNAFGPSTTGLSFNPSLETLVVGGSDSIRSSLVEINNANVPVRGNAAIIARIFWDGPIAGSDDGPLGNQYWLVRNGYSGSGQGFLFGLRNPDNDPNKATLQYFTYQGAGGTASVNGGFNLYAGIWYDIGIVLDDGGDISTYADNTVTFYAYSEEYGFQYSVHSGMYISPNPTSLLYIGSEDKGVSSGNQRKSFDGIMDYLAFFDDSLTMTDMRALMIPEPSRGGLFLGALTLWIWHRRRAS